MKTSELVKFWFRVLCCVVVIVGLVVAVLGGTIVFLMMFWPDNFGLVQYPEGMTSCTEGHPSP